MHPMLNTAIKAARRAGSMINRASLDLERLQVARKGPKDYVTEVDQSVEAAIIDMLKTAYPDHAFLGEESGEHAGAETQGKVPEYQWIIDPLDGTSNFIHGFPVYAVSIALAHRGQVSHAVIYDPSRNELFTASRGGGAFLNDRRVRVSGLSRYHDAMLSAYVPDSGGGVSPNSRFSNMLSGCASVRRMGASVLDLAYVACGRLDGFCGVNLKRWDLAAGGLLVLEAGGLIGDFQGEQTWYETGSVLAASPKIFTQMLAQLQA
ncbi:inositol monophosphatase family protein [Neopusillimonas aromaticivorans]|jgi:myo-inositol-1(or 4)-monophosphatase|uniref:inositol monophosphatase family protein n=1 Tax=Neopusillimonas aromaticivorans TaxID=2979868 RepID=UPI00259987F6|nr:inositol monophosphatase family protein [Neopusillimonas aromaticivorans]WJJ94052.1 inositol monophosphatase family protein [Neopusillimonas aromaticivorans]